MSLHGPLGVSVLMVLAYLCGSFPTSYLVGRLRGVDLREEGSGNLGATNVYRVLGAPSAVPVALVDVAKGFFPAWLFPLWDGSGMPGLALAYGIAAILGHVYPIFLRFRGGKGVATGAGVVLAVAPLALLVAGFVWLGLVLVTGIVSVASLAAATLIPIVLFLTDGSLHATLFTTAIALFVWWTHRENLARLWRGEEHGFRRSREAAEEERGAPPR